MLGTQQHGRPRPGPRRSSAPHPLPGGPAALSPAAEIPPGPQRRKERQFRGTSDCHRGRPAGLSRLWPRSPRPCLLPGRDARLCTRQPVDPAQVRDYKSRGQGKQPGGETVLKRL